ncbi:hypothetical protein [Micromonospora sp. PLK6-60]|uniref:hypothetical protein n=1 Tax=Micromonospora sp. PLK6-60 TaxID=2873383 RepID=UPI0027E210C0|nr:hypothetical protein [Micromonospora sp. PLK6-60]
MAFPLWSRLSVLSVAAVLVATLGACAIGPVRRAGAGGTPAGDGTASDQPVAPTGANRVSLVQKLGSDGPLRTLNVEPDGRWECVDCAGDGVTSTGALDPGRLRRLHTLLADPRLAGETDEVRQYRASCIDALTSSLLTTAGLITSQDCPGEERPPVAEEILVLLTQATPAEPTS